MSTLKPIPIGQQATEDEAEEVPLHVKETWRGHNFDEDAVCIDCGFDGAEWSHWRRNTYEGRASPDAMKPLCTHIGRKMDTHPPLDDEWDDDEWDDDEWDDDESPTCFTEDHDEHPE